MIDGAGVVAVNLVENLQLVVTLSIRCTKQVHNFELAYLAIMWCQGVLVQCSEHLGGYSPHRLQHNRLMPVGCHLHDFLPLHEVELLQHALFPEVCSEVVPHAVPLISAQTPSPINVLQLDSLHKLLEQLTVLP